MMRKSIVITGLCLAAAGLTNPAQAQQGKCLDQPPDAVTCYFSDLNCSTLPNCTSPVQVLAEQIVLAQPESIFSLRFWGVYSPNDQGGGVPAPDVFTVKFRSDAGGLPGPVISKVPIGPATPGSPPASFFPSASACGSSSTRSTWPRTKASTPAHTGSRSTTTRPAIPSQTTGAGKPAPPTRSTAWSVSPSR